MNSQNINRKLLEDIIFYNPTDQNPKYEISQKMSTIKLRNEIFDNNELSIAKKRLDLLEQNFINNQVL